VTCQYVVASAVGAGVARGDQDVLRVDDQVVDEVSHELAGAARRSLEVLVREVGDRWRTAAQEGAKRSTSAR
jgi:hypothetical protein